ncbi:UNVERIFIED_CONTAM: hypothetical protein K2H54_052877 [Gekko kuhli]
MESSSKGNTASKFKRENKATRCSTYWYYTLSLSTDTPPYSKAAVLSYLANLQVLGVTSNTPPQWNSCGTNYRLHSLLSWFGVPKTLLAFPAVTKPLWGKAFLKI